MVVRYRFSTISLIVVLSILAWTCQFVTGSVKYDVEGITGTSGSGALTASGTSTSVPSQSTSTTLNSTPKEAATATSTTSTSVASSATATTPTATSSSSSSGATSTNTASSTTSDSTTTSSISSSTVSSPVTTAVKKKRDPNEPIIYKHAVKVFHFIIDHWAGTIKHGLIPCGDIHCEWVLSDHMKHLKDNLAYLTPSHFVNNVSTSSTTTDSGSSGDGIPMITLSMYNIHSWWEKTRDPKPAICELHTNLTMAETEESFVRYGYLFDQAFKNFDGYSSTHPHSSIQRIYIESFLNASDFLPLRNFSSLIKAASYVASDCHRHDSANANRDNVVRMIRNEGFRVDGLGRCMHTEPGPEGVSLPKTRDTRYNLYLKRSTIGHFMFNFAFENSIESGYVTEKPFDAILAGTVPVYLGDAGHLKSLLPHPKAAIFVADFDNNYKALAEYLTFLTTNETAYEEHRSAWRKDFSYERNIRDKPLMQDNWWCRACQWAVKEAPKHHKRTRLCVHHNNEAKAVKAKLGSEWENLAVRPKNSKQVYLVKEGVLRPIPDIGTFLGLKLDFDKVKVIEPHEFERMIVGEDMPRMTA